MNLSGNTSETEFDQKTAAGLTIEGVSIQPDREEIATNDTLHKTPAVKEVSKKDWWIEPVIMRRKTNVETLKEAGNPCDDQTKSNVDKHILKEQMKEVHNQYL